MNQKSATGTRRDCSCSSTLIQTDCFRVVDWENSTSKTFEMFKYLSKKSLVLIIILSFGCFTNFCFVQTKSQVYFKKVYYSLNYFLSLAAPTKRTPTLIALFSVLLLSGFLSAIAAKLTC